MEKYFYNDNFNTARSSKVNVLKQKQKQRLRPYVDTWHVLGLNYGLNDNTFIWVGSERTPPREAIIHPKKWAPESRSYSQAHLFLLLFWECFVRVGKQYSTVSHPFKCYSVSFYIIKGHGGFKYYEFELEILLQSIYFFAFEI